MAKSIRNLRRIRSRLVLRGTSVKKISDAHGANVWSVYAALYGKRPGNDEKVQRALEEIRRA